MVWRSSVQGLDRPPDFSMEIKEEEIDFPISENVLIPFEDPFEMKQENEEFVVDKEIKEEPIDEPFPSDLHNDYLVAGGNIEFEWNESMEELGVKMEEEEEPVSIESSENRVLRRAVASSPVQKKPNLPRHSVDSKWIRIVRDAIHFVTTKSKYNRDGGERLELALYEAFTGQSTQKAISIKFDLPASSLRTYIKRVRSKIASDSQRQLPNTDDLGDNQSMDGEESRLQMEGENMESSSEYWRTSSPRAPLDSKMIQTIRDVISSVTERCMPERWSMGEKKEAKSRLQAVLYSMCVGELTCLEGMERLQPMPPVTFYSFHKRVRMKLSEVIAQQESTVAQTTVDDKTSREEETVDVEGIPVPPSVSILTEWITSGRIDFSRAQPFLGTKNELREKLINILQAFNFRGVLTKLVDGIMSVYVDGKFIAKAALIHKFHTKTLSDYARAVKIFIDFSKSPCSWEYRTRRPAKAPEAPAVNSRRMVPTLPLLRLLEERTMDEPEIKKEIKEEPIDIF